MLAKGLSRHLWPTRWDLQDVLPTSSIVWQLSATSRRRSSDKWISFVLLAGGFIFVQPRTKHSLVTLVANGKSQNDIILSTVLQESYWSCVLSFN